MANVGLQQPMRTLFPPLHVEKDDNGPRADDGDDDVLSKEIKDNFNAIRSALGNTSPTNSAESSSSSANEGSPAAFATKTEDSSSRKRKSPSQDTTEQIAVRTAVAVENEMSRLKSGIAELEALLAATSEVENDIPDLEGVSFPSLPPVVPDDIHDDPDEESDDEDHTKSGLCG